MKEINEKKGPRGYRFLVIALNVVLGLLLYWLLGFVMNDLSDQPGPERQEIQKKYQDPALVKEEKTINDELQKRNNAINEQQRQQKILETSINSYRDTMNQLLDLQKASIQKGMNFSSASQKNLQDVTDLYLNYQNKFQNLNSSITKDNLAAQRLQNRIQEIDTVLNTQNEEAEKEYNSLWVKHNWAMAGLQLLVLVPLLLIFTTAYRKQRESPYKSMIFAVGVAVFVKVSLVMHHYFPSYLFKYILILVLIYSTGKILVAKLRMLATPNRPWLEKQYSEAYQKNQCPICEFPIKPSISKFFVIDKKHPLTTTNYQYLDAVEAYTCPCCGIGLFNKCANCSHVAYSLLRYCDSCGKEQA